MKELTRSTFYFDYEHPIIQEIVKEFKDESLSEKEKAIGLYMKVRDGWRYNPYDISFNEKAFKVEQNCAKVTRTLY